MTDDDTRRLNEAIFESLASAEHGKVAADALNEYTREMMGFRNHLVVSHAGEILWAAPAPSEDAKIGLVYRDLWRRIRAEDYASIDALLARLDVAEAPAMMLLALLTITALSEVKKHLRWEAFYKRVRQHLVAACGLREAEAMLTGFHWEKVDFDRPCCDCGNSYVWDPQDDNDDPVYCPTCRFSTGKKAR